MKAFRGVLFLVPDYRDAAQKLSICAYRENASTLYRQAQRFCEEKNYDQAIQALAEVHGLDPTFVD